MTKKIVVTASELDNLPELERRLGGKVIQRVQLPDGKHVEIEYFPAESMEFWIHVWDCQATLVIDCRYITEEEWEFSRPLYDELITQIVSSDNGGVLSTFGEYYPQSQKSVKLFQRFWRTLRMRKRSQW